MNPDDAFKNLDNLISMSRLTRQEHTVLEQSLKTLYNEAKEHQEDKKEKP